MDQYRKKPVVIEAVRTSRILEAYRTNPNDSGLPQWVLEAYESGVIVALTDSGLTIKTLEGDHFAGLNDMVIRGVKGELYPCKADIFDATYEEVID